MKAIEQMFVSQASFLYVMEKRSRGPRTPARATNYFRAFFLTTFLTAFFAAFFTAFFLAAILLTSFF